MSGNYPLYNEDLFKQINQIMFDKKETKFNISIPLPEDADLEVESAKKCGKFRLSNTQKFLKTFMNGESPYRSLLLFHGVGTGKTCTSISIAEQFSDELERNHKKIIVVLNPSIQENFRKNIFNIQSYKSKKVNQQCLRDKYLKMIKSKKFRNDDELMSKINRKINAKYKFIGYQSLVNLLYKWESEPRTYESKIHDYFEDSVMIIDEVHNISKPKVKLDKDGNPVETEKPSKLPNYIEKIVGLTKNLKLLLLSATPMFNEPSDIVPLINLLRTNAGLPKVEVKSLFKGRELISREKLINTTRGLVSYLRSENPLAFPKRLYPPTDELLDGFPTIDIKGNRLDESDRMKNMRIVKCEMSGKQLELYEPVEGLLDEASFMRNTEKEILTLEEELKKIEDKSGKEIIDTRALINAEINFKKLKIKLFGSKGSFDSVGINVSNIVFPQNPERDTATYSQEGFVQSFIRNHTHKKFKLMPNYNNPEILDFLKIDKIAEYSVKIKAILDNIKKCKEGIVFVYSRYVWAGVVAIALALEVNGASNINGNIIDFKQSDYRDSRNIEKYLGLETREGGSLPTPGKLADPKGDFKGYTYTLITGNSDLSEGAYKKYLSIEPRNKNGERVKIILGSESASEGLDFKYIREVHMLDPWFHLNKLEQVIGRGIRNCSHIDLPKEKRNVTVYHYASTKPGDITVEPETIDLKIYREAENKDIHIANVEHTLKENAVDCEVNRGVNLFAGSPYNQPIEMIDSRGEKRVETLNDEDYSRICNYRLCPYDCGVKPTKKIDDETFNHKKLRDTIDEAIDEIVEIFSRESNLTLSQLVSKPELLKYSRDPEIIYLALEEIIQGEIPILSSHKTDSRLVYSEGYYIVVDSKYHKSDKTGIRLKLGDISRGLMKRTMKVDLTSSANKFVQKKTFKKSSVSANNTDKTASIDSIIKKLFKLELAIWNLNEIDRNTLFSFIWKEGISVGMSPIQLFDSKCRELFPTEYTEIQTSIEDLISKATDKTMELVKMKTALMFTDWYFSQVITKTGFFYYSPQEKQFKLKEWNGSVLVEREPGSKEHNTLLRKLDIKGKKVELSPLLGFIDSDGKFKIRDNIKKSKGKNTGRECETYTAKNILDYIEAPLITQKIPTGGLKKKDNLCIVLILSMIASNTPEKATFITLEDAAFQKLIKN